MTTSRPLKPQAEPMNAPWAHHLNKSDTGWVIRDSRGRVVCTGSWHSSSAADFPLRAESEANAALIVRAVNAHRALADQLKATADYLRSACLVITDPESRAMAMAQVRASQTLVDGLASNPKGKA